MKFVIDEIEPGKYRLDVRFTKNGEVFRRREVFEGTRRGAEKRWIAIRSELISKSEIPGKDRDFTVEDAIVYYLNATGSSIRDPKTGKLKGDSFLERVRREFGTFAIDESLYFAVRDWIPEMLRTEWMLGKTYNRRTIDRMLSMLKAPINRCIEDRVIRGPSPLLTIRPEKPIARDIQLSEDQLEKLRICMNKRPWIIPIVLYASQVGSRKSELTQATMDQIDEVNLLFRTKNGKTKNDAGAWKPIPPNMVGYFRNHPKECPWVFYRTTGSAKKGNLQYRPLGDFKRAWNSVRIDAGMSWLRFHDMRHIAATAMVMDGNSERDVMEVLGWKTNMLSTYYSRGGINTAKRIKFRSAAIGQNLSVAGTLKAAEM